MTISRYKFPFKLKKDTAWDNGSYPCIFDYDDTLVAVFEDEATADTVRDLMNQYVGKGK
jgi:hypothetical protein